MKKIIFTLTLLIGCFATVTYSGITYLVEVDKGLKSGEIKKVIPKQ